MKRPRLNFRNRSALEQIILCEQAVAKIAAAPDEQRQQLTLPDVTNAVAAARASHQRIQNLKSQLRTETTRRKELLREARSKVRQACNVVAMNLSYEPASMRAAGLEIEGDKYPLGKPAASGQLRAESHPHEGAVRLRFKRPLRRCSFWVEYRAESAPASDWKQSTQCLRQSCVVKGPTPGVKYWFRVRAINAHGEGPWSNLASARVK